MATIIQISGAVAITIGLALISIPLSLIVAGVLAVAFGIALERK